MSDEAVRLTYSDLAKARGITLAAARRMTLRHKWPKQIGNEGLTRVTVPALALARSENDGKGNGTAAGIDDITAAMKSLSNAVASLGEQLVRERERADRAEGQVRETE